MRLKDRAAAALRRQRERREWFDHLARAGSRYKGTNEDYLAAGITYFSFLSLFPLLLLAMSVAGFVLNARPDLLERLIASIKEAIPGDFGSTLVQAVATAATGWLLRVTGLDGVAGMGTLSRVLGLVVAAAGDTLVFGWLLARLPRVGVPYRSVLKGAVFAAVGFSILKVVGTYYVQRVSHSPTAGLFGSVIGILVWLNLVSRFLMFAAAWTATDRVFTEGVLSPVPGPATEQDVEESPDGAAAHPPSPWPAGSAPPAADPPTVPAAGLPTIRARPAADHRASGDRSGRPVPATRCPSRVAGWQGTGDRRTDARGNAGYNAPRRLLRLATAPIATIVPIAANAP